MLTTSLILIDLNKERKKEVLDLEELMKLRDTDLKKAAEMAYVIAMNAKKNGNIPEAVEFGRECLRLLDITNPQTMNECAPSLTVVSGIALPEFLHQDVVRDRLSPLEL